MRALDGFVHDGSQAEIVRGEDDPSIAHGKGFAPTHRNTERLWHEGAANWTPPTGIVELSRRGTTKTSRSRRGSCLGASGSTWHASTPTAVRPTISETKAARRHARDW